MAAGAREWRDMLVGDEGDTSCGPLPSCDAFSLNVVQVVFQ